MADDFSIDDILEEYAGKTVIEEPEIKSLDRKIIPDTSEIPVIVPEVPVVESVPVKTHATEETIGLHVKLGVKAQGVGETVVPEEEKESTIKDISVTQLIERAVVGIEEDESEEETQETKAVITDEPSEEIQPKKLGNTAIIEKVVKLKKQRAGITEDEEEDTEVVPVNRPKPEEIKMELTGKIIPETSQMEVIKPIEEKKPELSDEELAKQRQKKIDQFVLKEKAIAEEETEEDAESEE